MYNILGFYKFKKLTNLKSKKKILDSLFKKNDIRGTIIISNEGLNGTISYKSNKFNCIIKSLKKIFNIKKFDNKNLSKYKFQAFHKGKIKIKSELVPLGIKIKKKVSDNQLTPKEWNRFIKRKNTIIIDTRKNFEFKVGTFKNSINPELNSFREFPKYFKTLNKNDEIGMFCTGGIRCEKASYYLRKQGFKNIYQLKGGIINYLDKINKKDSNWKGDCFVFDNRVSIKHNLKPGSLSICAGCREPITKNDTKSTNFEEGVSCPNCFNKLTNVQLKRFRMRQKQIKIAKRTGKKYFYQREG